MSIDVVLCEKSKHFNDFLHVPFQLHKYNENWVPPLHHTIKRILDKKIHFLKRRKLTIGLHIIEIRLLVEYRPSLINYITKYMMKKLHLGFF
ncbi:hypothetical protein lpari_03776 [Legionella parisiensis]|uniref:Uncharacterized protein n=1 Tax=Legionella parisiensis TaxID=45071 RepID=A0A1E5JL64_9GAMM|nr:hypothetical protein lpari_03776 [Legionella parisiensis]